jgi:hypothetical protein
MAELVVDRVDLASSDTAPKRKVARWGRVKPCRCRTRSTRQVGIS